MSTRNLLAAVAFLVIAACGSTQTSHKVTSEQRNGAWQQRPLDKIAVVAVTQDRGERIGSETVFADQMKIDGINAVASYAFFPELSELDTNAEAAAAWVEQNIDAVLTVAVTQPVKGYDRGDYWEARGWAAILGSNNSAAWGDLADMSSYWEQGEYALDIGLWDARSMEPIWVAQTDSNEWDAGSAGVQRLADAIAAMLTERGFVDAQ